MRYRKAQDVIPEELLKQIQEYIDGEYLYIPRRSGNKKPWGYSTESKREIQQRNQMIYSQYQQGISAAELASTFFLTEKSIFRILKAMKDEDTLKANSASGTAISFKPFCPDGGSNYDEDESNRW